MRILDGVAGTAAKTRVLITSTDGKREWGTVGVSENIITASLQALVDSMEYVLMQQRDLSMSEIPKAYEPQSVEEKWYDFWLKHELLRRQPRLSQAGLSRSSSRRPTSRACCTWGTSSTTPSRTSSPARRAWTARKSSGCPAPTTPASPRRPWSKKTLRKQGVMKHRDDLGREKFLEHVWAWKEKHGGIIIQQLKKLGCSCDWTRERFTMDPAYSRCVQKVFVELYKKGLIYRGKRMVNWDPAARTALSDEEVEMIEEKGHLWHLKYPLLDDKGQPKAGEFLVVATTRPETMLGDEAVAVNPNDPRYQKIVGRKCLLPLAEQAHPHHRG